jgi:hypothetical protein
MPTQDGARGDQTMATQAAGMPPDEGGEHGPVRPVHTWSRVGSAEDSDLMAQHEHLHLLEGARAAQQQAQPKHLPEDQIQRPQRHDGDRARASERAAHRWSTDVRDILEPHRERLGHAERVAALEGVVADQPRRDLLPLRSSGDHPGGELVVAVGLVDEPLPV